jgi:signal transduction histidine kinase/CheY-like chemotaxis protein
MNLVNFTKKTRENFTAKIFIVIALLIITISVSFTTFFIYQQSREIKEALVKEGELLTRMLAYNGRLGVFAENEELLKDPVEGIMQNKDVIRVRVANHEGMLLIDRAKPGSLAAKQTSNRNHYQFKEVPDILRTSNQQLFFEGNETLDFWAPVLSDTEYFSDETLLFSDEAKKPGKYRVIGYVNVTLDKKSLDKALSSLLLKSCVIAIICLLIGLSVIYHVVKTISRPLNRLTERVNAMGTSASVEKVPIETNDEIGKLASAFNKMTDSLAKREAEKEILEEQVRHAQKLEAVGTLAGGVAHDFNNLLTAIIGYGILLQNGLTRKSALNSYIEQILFAAERAANLTQRLLAFSRKQVINLKPANLNIIVRNLQDILLRLIGENIELKVCLATEDVIINADEGQMDQVIINLVTNAKDAMPHGGTISLTTHCVELPIQDSTFSSEIKPGIYAALTVSDTGIGIIPETRDRIFDPFFTTKEIGKGTGLGLSIVYGIVQQHKGHIEVDTQPGLGTSVTILLPFFEPTIEIKRMENLLLQKGKKETILLAEDDRLVRNLTRHILLKYGYNVVEAVDGEDAIKKFQAHKDKIDLLLLDVIMPKMNGKQVQERISAIRPEIRTLFMSGYPFEIMSSQGILKEGSYFISKPLQPGALLMKLREVLETDSRLPR